MFHKKSSEGTASSRMVVTTKIMTIGRKGRATDLLSIIMKQRDVLFVKLF
jgi:hypothetical protein